MIQGIQTSESLVHLTGAMKPDDPDARIKFFAEEELCRVGGPVFDANRNLVANELRRRDCMMGEMRKNKPPFRLALNRAASDEIARHCKHCTERGVTKLHESGTALAEGMGVPASKMEELTAAHCQASLKTVKNPDREPYPAYPSGKSWCEACGKTGSGTKFHHSVMSGVDFAAQHKSSKHQPTKQAMQQRERKEEKGQGEEKRRGEKGREENGRKSEEKGVRKEDEEGDSKVVKDVTGWTVVTRNKRQKKMVQIFVKVNGSKATPMEVNLTDDKVEDVMRQVQRDEDVYVTMHGKVLRRNEKLKNCGVTDGCTIQVTSRMRGGGRHKGKSSKSEKKRTTKSERPEQKSDPEMISMDEAMRRLEEEEVYQENIERMSEGSEGEVQQKVQNYLARMQKVSWRNKEQHELLESGVWRRLKRGEKEGVKSKSNGDRRSQSNGDSTSKNRRSNQSKRNGGRNRESNGGWQRKNTTQDRSKASKASKCVSAKKNS